MAGSNNKLSSANSELKISVISEEELQCLDQSVVEKEIEKIIRVYYLIMVEQLWYVHLPELLDDLKAI